MRNADAPERRRKGETMNLSRCEKGHFYDKEKYASCPHCGNGGGSDDSLTTVFTEDMTSAAPSPAPSTAPNPNPIPVLDNEDLPIGGTPADEPTIAKDQPTVKVSDNNLAYMPTEKLDDDDPTVAFYDDVFANVAGTVNTPSTSPGAVVNQISSPCVGWLVALGGAHIGQDYHLKVGKNFIGRDIGMDIALIGDKSVSRNRHAIVVYEPKQHLYLVQPGDSSGLVYKNNEVVLSPVKLEAYDMITVGEVNLLFMPLCGERFNWSTLLDELSKKEN